MCLEKHRRINYKLYTSLETDNRLMGMMEPNEETIESGFG